MINFLLLTAADELYCLSSLLGGSTFLCSFQIFYNVLSKNMVLSNTYSNTVVVFFFIKYTNNK